jgi:putative membrane protein
MWSIILSGLATALSLLVVDLVVPGVTITTITAAAIAAVSVGLVNAFIKPILQTVAVPINFLTFGLFSLVVNGFSFWLASLAVPGFYVQGILGFILGPIVLASVSTFLGNYLERYSPALPQNRSDLSPDSSSQP